MSAPRFNCVDLFDGERYVWGWGGTACGRTDAVHRALASYRATYPNGPATRAFAFRDADTLNGTWRSIGGNARAACGLGG